MYDLIAAITHTARRRLSLAKLGIACVSASAALGLGLAPVAGATSLRAWPTVECYHISNTRAEITADVLEVNEDGLTTSWGLHLERWTTSGWRPYWNSAPQAFRDTVFGQLEQQPISVYVAPNSYYEAEDGIVTNDGKGIHYYIDSPIMGRYSSTICHT